MSRSVSFVACLTLLFLHGRSAAQYTVADLVARLDQQEAEIKLLRDQLELSPLGLSPIAGGSGCDPEMMQQVPLVMEQLIEEGCDEGTRQSVAHRLNFYSDYDQGFVIRAFDPQQHPSELRLNGWIQARHHGFTRDVDSWTDNAGVTRPVRNRSAFDIERARLIVSGHAIDPRLTYFVQLDGDTDGAHTVDFFDCWWGWQFNDNFQLQLGKRKVAAGRQWLLTARRTRFVDRPMADDFFRPDRTVGIFGVGKIGDLAHYELSLANGYNSSNIPNALTDDQFTIAATGYIEPLGDFGGQIVDYQQSDSPLVRLGHSFVYSPQASDRIGFPLDESSFVRLSDGTRLTQTGALATGVTVSDFDIFLYGIDVAAKYRGWSFNAEAYARWIEELRGDGPLPIDDLFQYGGYIEGGCFLIPQKFDLNGRCSQVSGEFGDASEWSLGCNWYPLAKSTMKISFDVTSLDGSPLQNTASDILVGDDGLLFRSQFQAEF